MTVIRTVTFRMFYRCKKSDENDCQNYRKSKNFLLRNSKSETLFIIFFDFFAEFLHKALSDMIVCMQTKSFKSFNTPSNVESCSLNERKFLEQYKESNLDKARNWNSLQINRVYPAGRRVDSSNLNPCKPWNMGFQISAMNYQTPDKERDINDGFFSLNGNSGYVMKPDNTGKLQKNAQKI